MKIRHNLAIQDDGITIKGQILETIFEEGERRGDEVQHFSTDRGFFLISSGSPSLREKFLSVFGYFTYGDYSEIFYPYKTPQEAQQIMAYINEFTVKIELPPYQWMWVSGKSENDARKQKNKCMVLYMPANMFQYITIMPCYEEEFLKGNKFGVYVWDYAVPIEQETIEINGKKYDRQEVEKAIESLNPID